MRPASAYIASFSITGLLLALALVVLIVFGALMAFSGGTDPDRSPPVSDVVVDSGEAEDVSERRAAGPRGARPAAPSTAGVVLTAPAPVAEAAPSAGAPVTTLGLVSSGRGSGPAQPAPTREAEPGRGGPGDVGELVAPVSPQAGETVETVIEQVTQVAPEERVAPVSAGGQPLGR